MTRKYGSLKLYEYKNHEFLGRNQHVNAFTLYNHWALEKKDTQQLLEPFKHRRL